MEAHLVDLQAQLVSTLSSAKRARVHLQLGRHALQDERLLASLTVPVTPRPGLLQRLLGR